MNVVIKAFDGPENRLAVEEALKGLELGTVVSLLWNLRQQPELNAKEHLKLDYKYFKTALYPDVDWNAMLPLDEELIEAMRHCEAIFMMMVARNSLDDIPYPERKRQYYRHLRYWNHMLETKKIDLFMANHTPHHSFDLVLYHLCLLKKIPTLLVHRIDCLGIAVIIEDYEKCATQVRDSFERLKKEFSDVSKPVPLTPRMERYYEGQTLRSEAPWSMYPRPTYLMKKNFVQKWAGIAFKMFLRKPKALLKLVTSPKVWSRKLREHRTIKFYDAHVGQPDLSKPYVYVPLHMQPELTTCPIGGAFGDQELLVQLLAKHLPEGVRIYVKEHPHQREVMRSEEFYRSLMAIPSVTMVPRGTSTVDLAENSVAVATVSGTAGFEGLFKERPVFLFGHIYYQYASGVYMIRSNEDCKKAVERVFGNKERPTLREIRLYLKAIEENATTYDCAPLLPGETDTVEQQNRAWGRFIQNEIKRVVKA